MKQRWRSSPAALALFLACALGSTSSAVGNATKTGSANNSKASIEVVVPNADIAGDYAVTGTNEDGSPYKGALKVIKHGEVYQFRWVAGQQYDGVGIPNGNVVAVAFTTGGNGQGCGVVNYRMLTDGTLSGKWAYWGATELGTETATLTGGSNLSGDYSVAGKNPNGSPYRAYLSIAPKAGGYEFVWSNNISGFGVKQGKAISVGFGGERCGFVAYQIKPDGTLDGIWGGYGSTKTGTEQAIKK